MHGEIARHVDHVVFDFGTRALECDRGKRFDVEKVCAAQMHIALFVVCIDARYGNCSLDLNLFGLGRVKLNLARKLIKDAVCTAYEMAHVKSDLRML